MTLLPRHLLLLLLLNIHLQERREVLARTRLFLSRLLLQAPGPLLSLPAFLIIFFPGLVRQCQWLLSGTFSAGLLLGNIMYCKVGNLQELLLLD